MWPFVRHAEPRNPTVSLNSSANRVSAVAIDAAGYIEN